VIELLLFIKLTLKLVFANKFGSVVILVSFISLGSFNIFSSSVFNFSPFFFLNSNKTLFLAIFAFSERPCSSISQRFLIAFSVSSFVVSLTNPNVSEVKHFRFQ